MSEILSIDGKSNIFLNHNTECIRDAAEVLHIERLFNSMDKSWACVNGSLVLKMNIENEFVDFILVYFNGDGIVSVEGYNFNCNMVHQESYDTHSYLTDKFGGSRNAFDHILKEKFGIERY